VPDAGVPEREQVLDRRAGRGELVETHRGDTGRRGGLDGDGGDAQREAPQPLHRLVLRGDDQHTLDRVLGEHVEGAHERGLPHVPDAGDGHVVAGRPCGAVEAHQG